MRPPTSALRETKLYPCKHARLLPRRPVGFECSRKSALRNRQGPRSQQKAEPLPQFAEHLELSKELLAIQNIDATRGSNSATKAAPLVGFEVQSETDRIDHVLWSYRAKRRIPAKQTSRAAKSALRSCTFAANSRISWSRSIRISINENATDSFLSRRSSQQRRHHPSAEYPLSFSPW